MARPYLGGSTSGVKTVSSDASLVPADSGKTILMGTNGVDITLPSAAAGMEFQIIQTGDYDTAVCTVVQASATEDFYGALYGSTQGENAGTDADVAAAANTKITFAAGSLKGDRVRLVSDGTGWYVEAFAQVYNAITFDN
jgi:hypothetical protein|tara:strand:- start:436 stop:855 length:420 start_codon:yes stop_codon:yes gene_type:complete